ncbi:Small GTPase superfamily protein [Actinidia chinensis var. chinensis]|uniref:Small GTPase superfamily protein n=1 Tax=Actinidia chinensis var. chinensis TaxID=1590841 RepID=A0A2R6RKC9_ACTCC|nr:Small GTPase superfamily protein [Actinidia chinensis var. chinensis]
MFWRENTELNGCGQIRVLVVGDSGVGKKSLVHLIVNGSSLARPPQTIGCTVGVKSTPFGDSGRSSNSIKGDSERDFFIELWDVSVPDRYKDCRCYLCS